MIKARSRRVAAALDHIGDRGEKIKLIKRLSVMVGMLVFLFCFLPITAYANSAPPRPYYVFTITDLPKKVVYVDLLMMLDEKDPDYVELVSENLPDTFSEYSDIVLYCEDGFMSYTFHCRNAKSIIRIDKEKQVFFFVDEWDEYDEVDTEHKNKVQEGEYVRLALLDEKGNIVSISSKLRLKSKQLFESLRGQFTYHVADDTFDVVYDTYYGAFFIYCIVSLFGMLFTCAVEYITLIPFGLRQQYGKSILLVNVLSQVAMHICFLLLLSSGAILNYIVAVLIVEILVYSWEFLIYRRVMKDVSVVKCLGYTIAANTASLLLGLIII